MRTIVSRRRERIALLVLFSLSSALTASAQTPARAERDTPPAFSLTKAVTDAATSATAVQRTTERVNDSVINGAVIGAGVAIAAGLFLCTRTEPWENCRDDVGPIVKIGAIGAGIGIAVDALIRRRKPVDEAQRSARVYAAPVVSRRAGGVLLSVRF